MKKIDARTPYDAERRDGLADVTPIADGIDADDPRAPAKLGPSRGIMVAVALSALIWIAVAYLIA